MVERIEIEATIPTVQYGNVKPVIVLEGESFDEIRDEALRRLKSISDMVAGDGYTFDVRGLAVKDSTQPTMFAQNVTKTSELTGVTVQYNDAAHAYTDSDGNKYLSGSVFPNRFYPDFDSQMILGKMTNKYPDVSALDITNMWNLGRDMSTNFGTAIHAALESYDKFSSIGEVLAGDGDRNKALSKNPLIRAIVEKFHEGRGKEDVVSECFIANEEYRLAGTIDRLLFVDRDKKIVRIQDYKTDGDIHEKKYQKSDSPLKDKVSKDLLGYHFLQLSFYAFILKQAGYTVEGLDIFWLNGEKLLSGENPWETYSSDVVEIDSVIKEK